MKCVCGMCFEFCPGCDRSVSAEDNLIAFLGDFEISVGEGAGRTIADILHPYEETALKRWAAKPKRGPSHLRLLRTFAKALLAHQELRIAAQEAGAIRRSGFEPHGEGQLALTDDGGGGETGGSYTPLHCRPRRSFTVEIQRLGRQARLIGKQLISYVQYFFPIGIWLHMVFSAALAKRVLAILPGAALVAGALTLAPRLLGWLAAKSAFGVLGGFLHGTYTALDELLVQIVDMTVQPVFDFVRNMVFDEDAEGQVDVWSAVPPGSGAVILAFMMSMWGPMQQK